MEDGPQHPTYPSIATQTASDDSDRPWLAHYSSGVPHALTLPDYPLPGMLENAARRFGANVAVEYYGTRITYAQLTSLVDRFARSLARMGVRRGDRVAVALPNVPQFLIAFFGALKAGAVVVPTNPIYTPPELQHQLNDSGARVVVMLDQYYPTLAAVRAETPVERVILTNVADYFPRPLALLYKVKEWREQRGKPHVSTHGDPTITTFKAALGPASDQQGFEVFALPEPAKPDDLAALQYTGGTTGVAKGAMLTHRNLVANALQSALWSEAAGDPEKSTLCVVPFFHVYGLTVAMNMTVANGGTMILLPRFTIADTLKAIERHKPYFFPGVPTMYLALAREVEKTPRDLSSIRVCISGSAPLPAEVQRRFEAVSNAKVVEGYGLTEASPCTHCNPVFGERHSGTIGLPMSSTEGAIINPETWEFLPVGAQGELVARGPQVMQGYWNRPEETAKVLRDGWLRTGDIAVMDAEGYFRIVDRAKDMIIAGGFNIFPREVDEALYQHPKVQEAATVGVPDEYRGETVRAYVVPKPGAHVTPEELTAFLKQRLAAYKVPKQYEFRESLPKTLVGKVLRRTLRDEYIARQQARG